jgi:hypothetical protein
VIDAYLGSHHDQDISEDMEEKIIAEAHAELVDDKSGTAPAPLEGEQRV